MAGGGPWARLAAALAPPAPPALRRPRPSLRHQTELLLLLLDSPPCPDGSAGGDDWSSDGSGPDGSGPDGSGSGPGGALLALLAEPSPGPPRSLLLVAALSVLAARGDRSGLAALAALLQRPGGAGGAPAAAAECLRELRRIGAVPGTPLGTPLETPLETPPGTIGTPGTPGRGCPALQPLLLLRAEGAGGEWGTPVWTGRVPVCPSMDWEGPSMDWEGPSVSQYGLGGSQ
ncbi:homeobox protein Hox-D11-like [Molothrus ater]|uniref:homeobox protein Hox-D11-like n=1 Tax=Molothrus ater TaxID=84834 RepID=UPI0023E88438|nr:homeobox protein Hox-D11-like [Molothrus ater]